MEEPEDYVVEEKLHFISKRVEVEPVKGRPTLHFSLYVGLFSPLWSLISSLSSVLEISLKHMTNKKTSYAFIENNWCIFYKYIL